MFLMTPSMTKHQDTLVLIWPSILPWMISSSSFKCFDLKKILNGILTPAYTSYCTLSYDVCEECLPTGHLKFRNSWIQLKVSNLSFLTGHLKFRNSWIQLKSPASPSWCQSRSYSSSSSQTNSWFVCACCIKTMAKISTLWPLLPRRCCVLLCHLHYV